LLNGISSHVLDFDDTHAQTAIHPAAPIAPAILALAEQRPVGGRDLIGALVAGVETECRIGIAVSPSHYEIGWHITGTAGAFGSAAAAGKLLGLNEQQMAWALGLAAAQPVGLQEMFGSMTKSFHPGKTAQNGLTAALLASKGFTASEQALEARRGWLNVMSTEPNYAALTNDGWELLRNSYKPFACGLVVHPVIDGCIQLRNRNRLTADMIDRVEVSVHPRVMLVTAIKDPENRSRRQVQRLSRRRRGARRAVPPEQQFSDESVRCRPSSNCANGGPDRRSDGRQGPGARHHPAQERRAAGDIRRARSRQRRKTHERSPARGQVPRPRRRHSARWPDP
jgi:2-methylcitrate dehydratase PrpD